MSLKNCPFCGEEILSVAIKCKHCQSNLTADSSSVPKEQPLASSSPPEVSAVRKSGKNAIIIGTVLTIAGCPASFANVGFGVFLGIVGIVIIMIGKFEHWYEHE